VRLGPPLRRFNRDILCTGWNYWDHFEESKGKREGQDPAETPKHPTFFTKGPDTVIGPFDDIAYDPELSKKWDYEAEVALVFGRDGRDIPEDQAWQHVFGFCVANDVSQRDLQRAHGGQWLKGKSIDATMPLGPWITTVDEIADPYALRIQCEVNGERRQHFSTKDMVFSFGEYLEHLSRDFTFYAGDIISGGTAIGTAADSSPMLKDGTPSNESFINPGDSVEIRSPAIGSLRTRVGDKRET